MKSAWPGLAILLLLPVNSVSACPPQQQQYHEEDPSNVADAARRAREQKKEQQPKPAKVWDNDTIPKTPNEVNVVGQTPAAAEGDDSAGAGAKDADATAKAATPGADGADAPGAHEAASSSGTGDAGEPSEKKDGEKLAAEIAAIQADLAAAKSQLQTAKADLDIAQRKFNLDSQSYYSKPNYSADKDGAANIDAEKAEIETKQQQLADAQMKVHQLEAKLSNAR
jgi:hypothetical protein